MNLRGWTMGTMLFGMTLATSSGAGGVNKFQLLQDYGDGFVRVQASRGGVMLSEIRGPKFKGTTTCTEDGYRVWKVGPKVMPEPIDKTSVAHSWDVDAATIAQTNTGLASSATFRKNQLDAACKAGHAAVRLTINESGVCRKIKGLNRGNTEAKSAGRTVSMGLECTGYNVSKKPLFFFRQDVNAGITQTGKPLTQFTAMPGGTSLLSSRETASPVPYGRAGVEGQVWTSTSADRRALYALSKKEGKDGKLLRETVASDPTTINELVGEGYTKGSIVGYLDTKAGAGKTPLYSYRHETTKDVTTVATQSWIDVIQNQRGYKLVRVEGYLTTIPSL